MGAVGKEAKLYGVSQTSVLLLGAWQGVSRKWFSLSPDNFQAVDTFAYLESGEDKQKADTLKMLMNRRSETQNLGLVKHNVSVLSRLSK